MEAHYYRINHRPISHAFTSTFWSLTSGGFFLLYRRFFRITLKVVGRWGGYWSVEVIATMSCNFLSPYPTLPRALCIASRKRGGSSDRQLQFFVLLATQGWFTSTRAHAPFYSSLAIHLLRPCEVMLSVSMIVSAFSLRCCFKCLRYIASN
jgi:hypothetical protein